MNGGQAEKGQGPRKKPIERERNKEMGKIGVLVEKASVFSSSGAHEAVPMNKIGQRLFEINEVGVFIIEVLV
jgi:hypothetical protein